MTSYTLIGLMSGTSMDGLDISCCSYSISPDEEWSYSLIHVKSVTFPSKILNKLKKSYNYSANELLVLDKQLGLFYAQEVNIFIEEHKIDRSEIDAIASHGHTIFHQPEKGYTYQIGCGDTIAFHTKLKVINDFRQKDVIAGGQGAPLVPIGDSLLFSSHADAFLNLGGFANCCILSPSIIAFDISPANLPLNKCIGNLGFEFDYKGNYARKGVIDEIALEKLNSLAFYQQTPPKSLGVEWLNEHFYPIIEAINSPEDQLRTIIEHVAYQIGNSLNELFANRLLVTGGGVYNDFLMKRIEHHFNGSIIVPNKELIEFKEALIFGFLGALFLANCPNTLAIVTGAKKDTRGGILHYP